MNKNKCRACLLGGGLLLLSVVFAQGQDVTIQGKLSVEEETLLEDDLVVTGDNGVVFRGTFGQGTKLMADDEWGARMLWYPRKAAFRAGRPTGFMEDAWSDANIGNYSAAFGLDNYAIGAGSFSVGSSNFAVGAYSIAAGWDTYAGGPRSMAGGDWSHTSPNASNSFAWGTGAYVYGPNSMAVGNSSSASGESAVAFNQNTLASGNNSLALGFGTRAESYASVAIGRYNVGGGSGIGWSVFDPVFEIGNGTGPSARSNIFTVYKGGKTEINGTLTVTGTVTFPGSFQVSDSGLVRAAPGASGAGNLAYSFAGDTDTGLYRSAANEMRFQTNGTDRLTVASNGNIGIGTTSPSVALHVNGSAMIEEEMEVGRLLKFGNPNGNTGLKNGIYEPVIFGSRSGGTLGGSSSLILQAGGTSNNRHIYLATRNSSGGDMTTRVFVEGGSGRVGIGTTSPEKTLHVNGSAKITGEVTIAHVVPQGDILMGQFGN